MKRMTNNNMPIGALTKIKDFLPSPEELAMHEKRVKVTISLSKTSIDFFKKEAKQYNTKYQRMIKNLLDSYAVQHLTD